MKETWKKVSSTDLSTGRVGRDHARGDHDSSHACRPYKADWTSVNFFFYIKSSAYIVVYFKQPAWYSKLHLFIPNGHKEHSKFARITFQVRVDGSVNHRYVNMHDH